MGIYDYEYKGIQKQAQELREEGYRYILDGYGYMLWYKEQFISGCSSKTGDKKHWRHLRANMRDYLKVVVSEALKHKNKGK